MAPPLQVPISCTDRPCISLRRPRFWGCTGHRLRRRVPACPPRAPPFPPPRPGRAVALPPRDRSCTGGRRVPRTNHCVNSVQSRAFGSTSPLRPKPALPHAFPPAALRLGAPQAHAHPPSRRTTLAAQVCHSSLRPATVADAHPHCSHRVCQVITMHSIFDFFTTASALRARPC